jgi:hypothetical protein
MLIQNKGGVLEVSFNGQGQVIGEEISEVSEELGSFLTSKYPQIVEVFSLDKELDKVLEEELEDEKEAEEPKEESKKAEKKTVKKAEKKTVKKISKILKKSKK